jgi:hypothetical protein
MKFNKERENNKKKNRKKRLLRRAPFTHAHTGSEREGEFETCRSIREAGKMVFLFKVQYEYIED